MKNKISIIVPVYNAEEYIEECLNSIFSQTYKNIELIIVDDKSTDNSVKLIENKIKDNKNVIFIKNKENKGSSYSRNIALKQSTGEFIGFIDSDDYIDKNYYELLIKSIKDNDADITVCDIKVFDSNTENICHCCDESKKTISFINNGLAASSCNKLFKRELIEKYSYYEGRMNEDVSVVLPAMINSNKIVYVKDIYYHYRQHKNSKQNSTFSNKRFDIFDEVELCLKNIKKTNDYKLYEDAIVYQQIIAIILYILPNLSIKDKKLYIKKFSNKCSKYDLMNNQFFKDFCVKSGRKGLYFKYLVKSIAKNNLFEFNMLTNLYNKAYRIIQKKTVIDKNITLEKIVKLAKKQSYMKEEIIKVSVVVPNYNYQKFLYERLYSILYQKYKISEIIILDDCSKDDSRKKIDEIVSEIKDYIDIKSIYNKTNSGTAFKQWQKGFEIAKYDYVWIAEADDYCKNNFLRKVTKPCIKNSDIVISYVDTAFINISGRKILKTIKPQIDIQNTGHWDKDYINDGIDEIKKYEFLNCTIANVSSAIIKNNNYSDFFKQSIEYKQAGDWLFYINLMSVGKVSYIDNVINYYRVHGNNVSSTTNYMKHLNEINKIHLYCYQKFGLDEIHKKMMNERIEFLKKAWKVI